MTKVSVSLLTQQASIEYDASGVTGPRDIIERIIDAGYKAELAPTDGGDTSGANVRLWTACGWAAAHLAHASTP